MATRKKALRCVVIHGHFYQPPRENPWIEAVEHQPSAAPHHDWNERIAWECYIPNAIARVVDEKNKIVDLVNNYAFINFNKGPTLLSWYEEAFPRDYQRLIEADRYSCERLHGHGNAIAQAYNHTILPLDHPRDAATQVRWGLADFRHRFGREPEAMWLPETACNRRILALLIEHGLRYVILSTDQAESVRLIGSSLWTDVGNGSIDPRRPYRWFHKNGDGSTAPDRSIDIFFFHGPLSRSIAFESAMSSSDGFADRLEGAFDPKSKEPQVVNIATDGESYGHHQRFADMGLAHLVKYDLPDRGMQVLSYGYVLSLAPPTWEVEIKDGVDGSGTSWSCAHGVERWRAACGCGGGETTQQTWRAPLRAAFDWLRGELSMIFETEGARYFADPWAARDGYIDVILDRRPEALAAFLAKHGTGSWDEGRTERALQLLEMQRHAMLMYTSCAWFFEEVSRLEPVQNLKYAARAMQLAQQIAGRRLEGAFVDRLEPIRSNLPKLFPDGRVLWQQLVLPSVVTPEQVTAQAVASELYEIAAARDQLYHYRLDKIDLRRLAVGDGRVVVGLWRLRSGVTQEAWTHRFVGRRCGDGTVEIWIRSDDSGESLDLLVQRLSGVSAAELPAVMAALAREGGQLYGLRDLFGDERQRILSLVVAQKMTMMRQAYASLFDELMPLATGCSELGVALPRWIKEELELAARYELIARLEAMERSGQWSEAEAIAAWWAPIQAAGLSVELEPVEPIVERMIASAMEQLEALVTSERLARLEQLVGLADALGCTRWRYRTENRMFLLIQALIAAHRLDEESGTLSETEWRLVRQAFQIAEQLTINVTLPLQRLMAWDAITP